MSEPNQQPYMRVDDLHEHAASSSDAPKKKKKRGKWLAFFVAIGILVVCAAIAGGQFFADTAMTVPLPAVKKRGHD